MSIYFENDSNLKSERKIIKIKIKDTTMELITDNGVFSKDKLDYGTRLLLETITKENLIGNTLDLGCGYGIIGIYLSLTTNLSKIDMVDVNKRAILLAKDNIKLNKLTNINVFESDIYSEVKDKYNYIITNPPIRAGKEILRKFLYGAKDYLKEDGQLWFVMRKDHGVKTMIKELENIYKIEIMEKSKGFYIVKCLKLTNK